MLLLKLIMFTVQDQLCVYSSEFTKRTSTVTTTKTAHSVDELFKFNHNTVINHTDTTGHLKTR